MYADGMHPSGGDRPYSPKRFDGQPGDEFQSLVGVDGAQSVGLAIVLSHFSQEFIV